VTASVVLVQVPKGLTVTAPAKIFVPVAEVMFSVDVTDVGPFTVRLKAPMPKRAAVHVERAADRGSAEEGRRPAALGDGDVVIGRVGADALRAGAVETMVPVPPVVRVPPL